MPSLLLYSCEAGKYETEKHKAARTGMKLMGTPEEVPLVGIKFEEQLAKR